jgi:transposase
MLVGRRYRLKLDAAQGAYAERVAGACRALWNAALEQRRTAAELNRHRTPERHRWPSLVSQSRELTEAKRTEDWLAEAPRECLQQTLRDLERACWQHHGPWRVRFRSKRRSTESFRFSGENQIGKPKRLNRRWGELRLPKMGRIRFRWTRELGGLVRNTTVFKEGQHWYISFCVDDGIGETKANGLPPVGLDLGVVNTVATSLGRCFAFAGMRPGEKRRLRRLYQQLSRQTYGSNRRSSTIRRISRLSCRGRHRRADFAHQTAHELTTNHGLVIVESLRIKAMTRSARGTAEQPGRNVRQKAGLNRAILDKAWGRLLVALEWHGQKNGCAIVGVTAAYTSQTCSACSHIASESRESQANFRCIICGYQDNADVNAAKNILAAGLAVTGRRDLGVARSTKRQPTHQWTAHAVT